MHFNINSLYFLLLIAVLGISSCKKDDDTPDENPSITYADLENAFKAIDITPGAITDVSLKATDLITWNIRVIAPTVANPENRPLIFALHGASGGDPAAHKATACYVEPGLEALGAFIISPNADPYEWRDGPNQQQILTLRNLAVDFWPVDENKVAVTGYSNGGNGSWFFGEIKPEIFSGAIPMASSYSTYASDTTGRKIDCPLYVIHGEDDELFPLDSTTMWVEQSIAAGSNITFVVAPGLGHYVPCDYVSYLKDGAAWLRDSIW